ncbi:MAG: hypothetical protein JWM05_1791 [Acidimicrobiales bacterium]|nr:hypothetical protein [Acidimicrobiales bacterium]
MTAARVDPLAVLSRVRASSAAPPVRPGERCEMCTEPIGDAHGHVVDVEARALLCACRGCYLLFTAGGAGGGHFKAVPQRCVAFGDVAFTPAQWDALQIPVSIAFFFVNSSLDRVCAFYPGPAGATESLLSLDTWAEVVAANPSLADLEPDVEAFLVRADPRRSTPPACYLVPIDWCYELVGELRRAWRGFDGGRDAHAALDAFFARVADRAER